jgi:phage terminase large subunit-like protein
MEQNRTGYRFDVVELGGQLAKNERISQLIPVVEHGKLYLPQSLWIETKDRPERHDMVRAFIEDEFLAWPYGAHDDMLDSLARILDPAMGAIWPKKRERPLMLAQRRVDSQSRRWVA